MVKCIFDMMYAIAIKEKDAREMLYELLCYNEALLRRSSVLSRKSYLTLEEQKKYSYLSREVSRSARAAIEMQKEIEHTWGIS